MRTFAPRSFTRRAVATATLAGAAIAVPVMMAGSASADSVNWTAIANCESSGNWAADTGNGFYGGLQFSESTWLAYGGGQYAQYANDASESQQISVAESVLAGQGIGAWPVCGADSGSSTTYSGTNTTGSSSSTQSSTSSTDNSNSSNSSSSSSSSDANSNSSSSEQSQSSSDNSGSSSSNTSATTSSTSSSSSNSSATGTTTYTVVSGDTLSEIAAKEGVSSWHKLYHENKSVVGSNPNLIYPGQVLTIG